MAKPQYGWRHQQARAKWAPIVERGEAHCCETVCLKASRHIGAAEPWDLAHTPDGGDYLGPAHEACNRSEGAIRGNRGRVRDDKGKWIERRELGSRACPACGAPIKWASAHTCSRECASKIREASRLECKRGHSMADAYTYPSGHRECRTCKREAKAAWQKAHRESARAHHAKWEANARS